MNSFSTVGTIAKRELLSYFNSTVAYVFIVIFLGLVSFFTFNLGNFFERGEASLAASFFFWHPWLYLFLVPAIGMRVWAEEQRLGTMELLLTMPVEPWQAIVGKFLAAWLVLALSLALTFPLVLTVNYLGRADNGTIICSYLGSLLLCGTYLAITCATSAMTRNQVVSFILSLVVCLVLALIGVPRLTQLAGQYISPTLVNAIASLSVVTHFENFQRGVVDLRDLVFFFSVIGFSLFFTGVIIRHHRA
jgi:ABC-2 type transport system permease protein